MGQLVIPYDGTLSLTAVSRSFSRSRAGYTVAISLVAPALCTVPLCGHLNGANLLDNGGVLALPREDICRWLADCAAGVPTAALLGVAALNDLAESESD